MTGEKVDDIERIKSAAEHVLKHEIRQLPMVPAIALKLFNLTHDDNTKFDDLARLIETEPSLSAKILQHVNSAAFALPNPVGSIHRAVNLLGFSAVRRTALALIFFNRFNKQGTNRAFDPLFFWQHCLFVASLSRRIALALAHPDPERVYTAGLLHDIGKAVLETCGRRSYSDYIATLNSRSHSTLDKERHYFGMTHSEIGYLLCLEWGLPESVAAVVINHHQPTVMSPNAEFDADTAMVSFADYIAWMHGIASFSIESQPALSKKVLDTIDTSRLDLENLLQEVDKEMFSIRDFFGIEFPDVYKLRATLVQTSIALSQNTIDQADVKILETGREIPSSLTAPHQSLDPDHFVPMTLEAIRRDFDLDHVMMFTIDPIRRSLVSTYFRPEPDSSRTSQSIEIPIGSKSGLLLNCLREKKPILINAKDDPDNPILKQLDINECFTAPILQHRRLIGLITAYNSVSKKTLPQILLTEIMPIAHQLGIALLNAKRYDDEKKRAQMDSLTQLLNKRAIDHALARIFQQHRSKLEKLAIGFVDIDKFKLFNDTCGHQAGDEIIRTVAEILTRLTRPDDIIGRYGGEEFLFVLNGVNTAGALSYAERIRSELEHHGKIISPKFNHLALTVSIGISLYHPDFSNYSEMIEAADQAMYRAKNEGRNRVIVLNDSERPKK